MNSKHDRRFGRLALPSLMACTLGACAMDGPAYPIRQAEAAPTPPPAAAPVPAYAPSSAAGVASVNTMAPGQPQRSDAAAVEVAQTGPAPGQSSAPPAADMPAPEPDRPPITEGPVNSSVLPPVNRRPGADSEVSPPAPPPKAAPTPTRAAKVRTPPPAPAPRPLVAGKVVSVNDTSHTVEVQKGDTVNTISDGLMTPKEALIKANRLKKPYELDVGQTLKIPVRKVYIVQSGDSLYGIAKRFSTPVDTLSDLNQLDAKSHLRTGQKIALPELAKDGGPIFRPGESGAETAKAEERPRSRKGGESSADETPPASAAETARAEASGSPSEPRPYASLGDRPSRGAAYVRPPSRSSAPPGATSTDAAPPPADSQIQLAGRGRFVWPVRGDVLSGFGSKPGGQRNDGLDIAAAARSPVRASAAGDVVYSGDKIPGFGNLVLIKHEGGWVTAYAHLALSEVKIKQHVQQGDEIGQVGQTGGVDQPELHFEIRYAPSPRDMARPIDPNLVLSRSADP